MVGALRRTIRTVLTPLPAEQVSARYTVALLTGVLAVILRWALDPLLGHVAFYVTVYIAVAYCAVVCGYAPGMLSALLGFVGIFYWFIDPRHSLWPARPSELHGIIGFFMVTAVLLTLGEANRNKQQRLSESIHALSNEIGERQLAQRDLQSTHDELEKRVHARTMELSEALGRLRDEMDVREHTEERLRHLSLRLMRLQDEERRHIARELHDTCGQTLAAMKMSIAQIRQLENSNPALDALIDDLNALTDSTLQDVRTTSYLLHPPLLDEAGIPSAIRWFTEGFATRSGIKVQCEIGPNMGRSPREFELVLFRVLQESLTNVHRHSGASSATVRLQRNAEQIQLEIRDNGRGIAQERLRALDASEPKVGVGITGMRERVHQLGGHLELLSNASGTTVSVMLPLSDSQDSTRPDSISIAR